MQYFDALKEVVTSYLPAKQVEIIQDAYLFAQKAHDGQRSEERRVGKECRSGWSPHH